MRKLGAYTSTRRKQDVLKVDTWREVDGSVLLRDLGWRNAQDI